MNDTGTLAEASAENAVGILEHAILERDDDELGSLESGLDESTDVLCVGQIQGSIDLVKNVHGRGLELQEGHDQGQGNQRPETGEG